ncbi:hypothetical protein [Algiphilus sp.]|uniref:hypothetical protein n=1 Tax=Algiphilus sp. TaxID=1872431 RepID=UPI0032ECC9CB
MNSEVSKPEDAQKKKSAKKKASTKKAVKKTSTKSSNKQLAASDLPRRTLEECLEVARPIHEIYAGSSASWDEIASAMDVGPKSPNTKYLIWAAQAYDLIFKEGDKFRLSETGRKILAPNYEEERQEAIRKAILVPTILSRFYSDYDGKLIPEDNFLENVLENRYSIPRQRAEEAKRILLGNAAYGDVLMSHPSGKQTIRLEGSVAGVDKEMEALDEGEVAYESYGAGDGGDDALQECSETEAPNPQKVCFYITPIGDDGSEERRHSDMLLRHLIEPAFSEFNMKVIRADKIGKSGLISQQIFEQVIRSKFCVADLSFGNPNAFYELGIRHMTKLPTIQIIRKGDRIPFDVAQGRTIVIDVSDIYTVMDRISSAKNELIEHIQSYMSNEEDGKSEDNPVSIYLPGLQVKLPKN